jgi:hypothetical protein
MKCNIIPDNWERFVHEMSTFSVTGSGWDNGMEIFNKKEAGLNKKTES